MSGPGRAEAPEVSSTPLRAMLFAVVFALAAALGYVGPLGFAALVGVAGLLCVPALRPRGATPLLFAVAAGLVALAAVSLSWSPYGAGASGLAALEKSTALKLALEGVLYLSFAAAAGGLSPRGAERAVFVLAVGLCGLAALMVLDGFAHATLYLRMREIQGDPVTPDIALRNVAQGSYVIAVLIWPASVILRRRGHTVPVLGLIAAVAAAMLLFSADAPTLAVVLGAAVFWLVLRFGSKVVSGLAAFTVFYWLAAPWIVLGAVRSGLFEALKARLPASWDARLDIWAFTAERIVQAPWLGWGLDASRTFGTQVPLHPHDGALQVWLELGLAGAGLVAAFWFLLFRLIGRMRDAPGAAAAASAAAVAYLTIGALSFGVWQEWWLALGALVFAACACLHRAPRPVDLWPMIEPRADARPPGPGDGPGGL